MQQLIIRKVRLFGLHLLPLDLRKDARLIRQALDEMFRYYGQADDYLNMAEEDKEELLRKEIISPRPFFPADPQFSEVTNRIINTWRMIATARGIRNNRHRQYHRQHESVSERHSGDAWLPRKLARA